MFNELKTSRMRQEQCGDVSFVCRIHVCGKLRTTTNTSQRVHRINLTKTKIHVSEKKNPHLHYTHIHAAPKASTQDKSGYPYPTVGIHSPKGITPSETKQEIVSCPH